MFQGMKNIQSAFSYVKSFTLVVVVGCLIVTVYAVDQMSKMSQIAKQQMLVIDGNGNLYQGKISSRASNLKVEAKAHLRKFHELFFEFDPERSVIDENKSIWTYMADKSAIIRHDKMEEQGFFQNVIASSVSSRINIEDSNISIEPTSDKNVFTFTIKGKQNLYRESSYSTKNLITKGFIRVLENRTDKNPHGFMIVNFDILDNETLTTQKRYASR